MIIMDWRRVESKCGIEGKLKSCFSRRNWAAGRPAFEGRSKPKMSALPPEAAKRLAAITVANNNRFHYGFPVPVQLNTTTTI